MSVLHNITSEALATCGFRCLHAGDDYAYKFTLKRNGTVVDLTTATIWMTLKESSTQSDADAKLQLMSSGTTPKIVISTPATAGIFTVNFSASATADLEGTWLYDIQVKIGSPSAIMTCARGVIEFLPNLTRSTT